MLRAIKMFSVLAVLLASQVQASGIRVAPLRLVIDETARTASLAITNLGATATAVEVELVSWRQADDGSDVYAPSSDLFFAPPIVRVPARGQTTLRFRAKQLPESGREASYRVYVRELPQQAPAGTRAGTQIALRFGIPVFVYNGQRPAPTMHWSASRTGNQLDIDIGNSGQAHLRINALHAYPAESDINAIRGTEPIATARYNDAGAGYLMPGTTHSWAMDLAGVPDNAWILIATDDTSGRAADGLRGNGHLWLRLNELLSGSGN